MLSIKSLEFESPQEHFFTKYNLSLKILKYERECCSRKTYKCERDLDVRVCQRARTVLVVTISILRKNILTMFSRGSYFKGLDNKIIGFVSIQ